MPLDQPRPSAARTGSDWIAPDCAGWDFFAVDRGLRDLLALYLPRDLLERLTPPIPEIAAEYSVIVHRDLRRAVCVRAVIDWVRCAFAEHRDALAGAR